MQVAREMKAGQRVVTLLPDSVRNYMTKFVDDAWMRQHGFLASDWEMGSIGDIVRTLGNRPVYTVDVEATLGEAVTAFREQGISQLPCTDGGALAGILTEGDVLSRLVEGRANKDTSIAEVMVRNVSTIAMHASAGELPRIFERGEVAVVVDGDRRVLAILTKIDLINFLSQRQPATP
jgi:cystathionine beta-synthase